MLDGNISSGPIIFPGEHHEIEPGPVAARLVHSVSQPPAHIRWILGRFHQRCRQRKPLAALQDFADKAGVGKTELPSIQPLRADPNFRKVSNPANRETGRHDGCQTTCSPSRDKRGFGAPLLRLPKCR